MEKNLLLDMYDVQELLDWMEATPTEDVVVSLPTSSSRTIVVRSLSLPFQETLSS